jgi:hypothetical protein
MPIAHFLAMPIASLLAMPIASFLALSIAHVHFQQLSHQRCHRFSIAMRMLIGIYTHVALKF